jgi:predicted transport protein
VGHYSPGNTKVTITEPGEIPYVSTLIKQAYEKS